MPATRLKSNLNGSAAVAGAARAGTAERSVSSTPTSTTPAPRPTRNVTRRTSARHAVQRDEPSPHRGVQGDEEEDERHVSEKQNGAESDAGEEHDRDAEEEQQVEAAIRPTPAFRHTPAPAPTPSPLMAHSSAQVAASSSSSSSAPGPSVPLQRPGSQGAGQGSLYPYMPHVIAAASHQLQHQHQHQHPSSTSPASSLVQAQAQFDPNIDPSLADSPSHFHSFSTSSSTSASALLPAPLPVPATVPAPAPVVAQYTPQPQHHYTPVTFQTHPRPESSSSVYGNGNGNGNMHHAPPPLQRPASVHSVRSIHSSHSLGHGQISVMGDDDDGDFEPMSMDPGPSSSSQPLPLSQPLPAPQMHMMLPRQEMQRAHSMSYVQRTPYGQQVLPPHHHQQFHSGSAQMMHTHSNPHYHQQHQQQHAHSQGPSPYAHSTPLPVASSSSHPQMLHPAQSPTDGMLFHAQQQQAAMAYAHAHGQAPAQAQSQGQMAQVTRRPGMPQRHSTLSGAPVSGNAVAGPSRPGMQRQYSLQPPPARVVSNIGHDVFAAGPAPGSTPVRRVSGMENMVMGGDQHLYQLALQGISPARALGPAPIKQSQYPIDSALTTPAPRGVSYIPSSVTSTSVSGSSSAPSSSTGRRRRINSGGDMISDDEDNADADSPTRPSRGTSTSAPMQMHQAANSASPASSELSDEGDGDFQPIPSKSTSAPAAAGPNKAAKPPVVCRTSAKLARTAEDPGVEGVPPGPRPTERPTPSFACIIGEAILNASAGGLSLEHIYRYVETAYPFFKTGDGAWRNSVRHNLSIHKMFGTIPRTEKFPPGKGGIWVIHEEEKIHWPSEGKFIKNFPAAHPHHANCRQTQHERQKEQEAMAKAHAEGKEYVPRKGKKGRKLAAAAMAAAPGFTVGAFGMMGEDGYEMGRTASAMSDAALSQSQMSIERPLTGSQLQMITPQPAHHMLQQQQQQQATMGTPVHGHMGMMPPHGMPMHPTPMPMHLHPAHAHAHHPQHFQQQQQQMMMPPPMSHTQQQHVQMVPTPTPGPLQPMVHQHQSSPIPVQPMQMVPVPMRPLSAQQQQPLRSQSIGHGQLVPRTSHASEEDLRAGSAPPPHAPAPAPATKRAREVQMSEDDENVFSAPKRVRLAEAPAAQAQSQGKPLAALPLPQQLPQHILQGQNGVLEMDDAYVTPEHKRIITQKAALSSGAFKTPALVDSSSSPTSSPMPPTLPRGGASSSAGANVNNPSTLHQAWTNDDILTSASPSGSGFSLDAAFDIKPKISRKGGVEDDALWPPLLSGDKSSSPRAPPKTPLTRSSAAADRTPRHPHRTPFGGSATFKTPINFAGSPMLPYPVGHEMSTPAWELSGIFDRLEHVSPQMSPSRTGGGGATSGLPLAMRSPLTSTDPSRYASMLNSGDGSPKGKGRMADSPFKRPARHGHGHGMGMGSIGSIGSLSDIATKSGVLLPSLKDSASKGQEGGGEGEQRVGKGIGKVSVQQVEAA